MEYADAILAPHIKHREGFEFVAVSAMNDAIQDGIVLLEMSFDIRLAEFYPNGVTELCTFIEALVERVSGAGGSASGAWDFHVDVLTIQS